MNNPLKVKGVKIDKTVKSDIKEEQKEEI